jgi:hypothetical protein
MAGDELQAVERQPLLHAAFRCMDALTAARFYQSAIGRLKADSPD